MAGRASRVITGLTIEDHRALALELNALQAAVLDVRERIKAAEGTAVVTYTTSTRVLSGLKAWRSVLHRDLIDQYGDRPGLRTIYEEALG